MIEGKKVILCGVEEEHLGLLLEWRNNPEHRKYYREYRVLTIENQRKWWRDKIVNDDTWQYFVVKPRLYSQEGDCEYIGDIIGVVGLTSINHVYRTAEFAITIGNHHYRGRGYGSDALSTIIKYGFQQLNLNRIWCEVYSNNNAIEIYKRIGFKLEGTLRQTVFKDGEYLDSNILGLLQEEWDILQKQNAV